MSALTSAVTTAVSPAFLRLGSFAILTPVAIALLVLIRHDAGAGIVLMGYVLLLGLCQIWSLYLSRTAADPERLSDHRIVLLASALLVVGSVVVFTLYYGLWRS